MNFWIDYGLFALKITTVLVALGIFLTFIVALKAKNGSGRGRLNVTPLNEQWKAYTSHLLFSFQDKKALKAIKKAEKKEKGAPPKNRLFVIDFVGDIRAKTVGFLKEEITAILLVAKPHDRVVVRLESPGGMVHAYGLAASQLKRVRTAGIPLTICVDKMAASGGYLMACIADELIASPFAIIGSIGVIAQIPNFNRLLKQKDIDFEQITAGEFKRTLTMFGENTEKGREKMQTEVNETHTLFKDFIKEHRPTVGIDQVATGEHWYGAQALPLKLIDHIQTSEDYLLAAKDHYNIYAIRYEVKRPTLSRLSQGIQEKIANWNFLQMFLGR